MKVLGLKHSVIDYDSKRNRNNEVPWKSGEWNIRYEEKNKFAIICIFLFL
jgi:hypothetical protein